MNDCSTDTSLAIATSFAANDERIKIINNVINLKLPASLNVGHHAAKGEFISWTSDDNMYHHNAIEVLLQQLVETISDITFSGYQMIEHDGKNRREVQPLTDIHIVLGNCIGASFLYKSVVFKRNDGYNEDLHTVEDYDFWLRAFKHSRYSYTPQVLYKYRIHKSSLTAQVSGELSASQIRFENNLLKSYRSFFVSSKKANNQNLAEYAYALSRIKEMDMFSFLKVYSTFRK